MQRYSGNGRYRAVVRSRRYQPIIVILILIAIVVLVLKLAGVGSLDTGNYERQRNARLNKEVQDAVAQVNSLSRLGATSTSSILGKIRQYVHGVEVLNNLNVSMYGEVGRLYKQALFDSIYGIITQYETNLSTGQKINESLNLLSEAITGLQAQTQVLIGAAQQE